ncbi:MAG: alpha/beta fold hydrolase [Acidobacteriota bacterium]
MATSSIQQTLSINDIEMYCEIYGEGEPLVLLHGFSGCGSNWQSFVTDFVKEYQLIIPDLRGHGRTTNPSNTFTFRQSALDLFAMLDLLNIEKFKAIGLSGGAKTLLHMATQQPARIEAMVIVSCAPYFPDEARAIMQAMTPDSHTETEWQQMREWHKHGDAQIRALWTQAHHFKDSFDDMNFTPPLLSTITARTLIVHGDRDPFYPARLAIELYEAMPNAYLWMVPNAGHGPIFLEMTAPFIATALPFLRGDWQAQ